MKLDGPFGQKTEREYNQGILESQSAGNPMARRGRATH